MLGWLCFLNQIFLFCLRIVEKRQTLFYSLRDLPFIPLHVEKEYSFLNEFEILHSFSLLIKVLKIS